MRRLVTVTILGLALAGCSAKEVAGPTTTVTETPATVTVTATATTTAEPPKAETFDLKGRFVLTSASKLGESCYGTKGYDDIQAGTAVTVYDPSNNVIGLGALADGKFEASSVGYGMTGDCTFTVLAESIPADYPIYQVEISHRGKVNISQADAKAGKFTASLG